MRKFVVRLADGSEQCLIRPLYDTRNEAVQGVMNYVSGYNEDLYMGIPSGSPLSTSRSRRWTWTMWTG